MTPAPVPVLTAVTGPWEAALAAGLGGETQVRLVRRCADLAELLAAALAGLAGGVVLSADLPRLDGDALARLRAAGVGVVVLVAPGDTEAAQRMRLLGVADLLPADTPPPAVARAVAAAVSGIRLSAPSGGHLGGPGTGEPPRSGDVVQAAAAAVPPDDPRDRPVGPAPGPAGPAAGPGAGRDQLPAGLTGRSAGSAGEAAGSPSPTGSAATGLPPTTGPAADGSAADGSAADGVPCHPSAAGSLRSGASASGWSPSGSPGSGPTGGEASAVTWTTRAVAGGVPSGDGRTGTGTGTGTGSAEPDAPVRPGRLLAVWGPTGAPGRTTVAVGLAAELAELGFPTILADADTYGPSVAQTLALLDESAGLAAAVRAANQGTLDVERLARLAPRVQPDLRVLTGIPRPGRWPELRPSGLDVVWQVARQLATWTVADCGFGVESDGEAGFGPGLPRRDGATLCTLAAADVVVVVGSADPVGLHRLVRALQDLRDTVPDVVTPRVVVSRVRESAVGPSPQRKVAHALARYAGVDEPVLIPDDRSACDAAMLAGRTLAEIAPQSPARLALHRLAEQVAFPAGGSPAQRTARQGGRLLPRWGRRIREGAGAAGLNSGT